MNVGELKAALDELPDDMLVVMSKDGEGNRFSPLSDTAAPSWYVPETTWSGEWWAPEDHDPNPPEDAVASVILWPVN